MIAENYKFLLFVYVAFVGLVLCANILATLLNICILPAYYALRKIKVFFKILAKKVRFKVSQTKNFKSLFLILKVNKP